MVTLVILLTIFLVRWWIKRQRSAEVMIFESRRDAMFEPSTTRRGVLGKRI